MPVYAKSECLSYKGKNVLDLLFTNSEFISYKCSYDNRSISDHNLIEFSIDLSNNKDMHIPIKNPYQYKICEYDVSIENLGWSEFYCNH